jgi:hypothetical protein
MNGESPPGTKNAEAARGVESLTTHSRRRRRLTCAENPSTSIASQVSRSFNLVTALPPAAEAQIQKEGQP